MATALLAVVADFALRTGNQDPRGVDSFDRGLDHEFMGTLAVAGLSRDAENCLLQLSVLIVL